MCYNAPGPRCAGHTRTLFRQTKEALIVANANFEAAKHNLSDADDLQAQAALMNSEKMLKLAQANHADATEKYEASKADRAEKMDAYHEARDNYLESAEGIQGLRDAGKTDEAEKYATIRAMKMEELKRVEATKADIANGAIKAVIEKPATVPAEPTAASKLAERYNELAQEAADQTGSGPHRGAYRVTRREDCPADILGKLANNEFEIVRSQVAQHNNTDSAVLAKLATDSDPSVRKEVARNKNTDASTLKALAGDESEEIRYSVGLNENCPPSVLESLSKDSAHYVRYTVAKHPKLPVSAMLELKNDDAPFVISGLGTNTALPVDIQRELVGRRDPILNKWLAKNKSISKKVLKGL